MFRRLLLAVLFTAAAAPPAAAQITPPPDPDTPLIQAGPFGISPTLMLRELGRDENVFNERDDPKGDFTFTLLPRAEVLFKPRALRVSYVASTEYVYYRTYESERSTNVSSAVRADLALRWLHPYVMASGTNTRQRLNQEVDIRARRRERVYGGGVGVRVGTRLTLGAAGRTTRLRFDEGTFRGEDLAASFDSDLDAVDASAGLQLTPFTSFVLTVSHEQQRFRAAGERDSDSLRITPSFTFSPEAVLNGSIALGYRRFSPRNRALADYAGLVATATVGTTLWSRHRLEMIFARDLRYSYERATPYYLATGGNVTVTSQLAGPFDLRLIGGWQSLDYRGVQGPSAVAQPGNDTFSTYGGGLGYRLRDQLRLGINAEWSGRDSELSLDREYRNRRIFASVTWGKQI
ncbi:MAG TPA: outer membrane beta-barrel protein [Vicinamibacterales bacterium]|nr:outer membrane beta-barrel protein [Vicinamibacterales bacterium]